MKKQKEILILFLEFLRFGLFTFGGGWGIVSQMQQLYVEKKKTISPQELLDLTSVGRSLPGTMIGNVAMFYGYRMYGIAGGFAAVIGMVTPPMVILILISFGYNAFRTNYWVAAGMEGVQAAVAPIVASACVGLAKGSIKGWQSVVIMAASVVMYLVFEVSAVKLVLFGVACGLLLGIWNDRKGAKCDGAA